MALSRAAIEHRRERLNKAESDDFATLVQIASLDKKEDLRHADWSDVSFRHTFLKDFDFTAARLHNCDFARASIAGACFNQAELGAVLHHGRQSPRDPALMTGIANLHEASDWAEYLDSISTSMRGKRPAPCDPSHLPVGAIFSDAPGFSPEMVVVPAGRFLMGSPDGSGGDNGDQAEEARFGNEGPRQWVTFDRPFAIGRFTTTVTEFEIFAASKKSRRKAKEWLCKDDDLPVTDKSWLDAVAYCEWLNAELGLPPDTYRLPSEAEWEYAARAGTDGPFWWEGPISVEKANYTVSAADGDGRSRLAKSRGVVPVQTYSANPWGLYQVHGNVWEWCQDAYVGTLADIPADGSARTLRQLSPHVLRGGSCAFNSRNLRSAYRLSEHSDYRLSNVGFRLARTL